MTVAFQPDGVGPTDVLLNVDRLSIDVADTALTRRRVVDGVSFSIRAGEVLALVGESGSGKSMIGRAILRLLPPAASWTDGEVVFDGTALSAITERQMRGLRGRRIGVVFQEPMTSLNPALSVGFQMAEALRLHQGLSAAEARRRCIDLLGKVKVANPAERIDAFPHQFSGGMRQRIMLASALALKPALLIADEPTTALDALVRKEVMDLMLALTRESGTALLLISHDLGMVAQYADKVVVLRQGQVVVSGPAAEVLLRPREPYTRALMGALPARDVAKLSVGAPLIKIDELCVDFNVGRALFRPTQPIRAVDGASLSVRQGEVLALVGESGSGKTTIGRTLMRLCKAASGRLLFDGQNLGKFQGAALAAFRRSTQMVFQDPYSSLDPRMRLGEIVAEGLRYARGLSASERFRRAVDVLEEVGLPNDYVDRYPHELSGGQRQRVCIARAIVARPRFIVADEPVSALDVTVQRQVLNLLATLQKKYAFTQLFISHDLSVVEQIADRVAVMRHGKIVEIGSRDAVFDTPRHPYTTRLLEATPRIRRTSDGGYALISAQTPRFDPPPGFHFFGEGDQAAAPEAEPSMIEVAAGHWVCCNAA